MIRKTNLLLLLTLALLVSSCRADSTVSEPMPSDSTPFTPDICKEILFYYSNVHTNVAGGENIYAICPGDTTPRKVTYGENFNRNPQWSPDRSLIAFLSYSTGSMQIHIMDRDGENNRQLTSGSDLDAEGVVVRPDGGLEIAKLIWLPDGDRVAVALQGYEGLIWQTVHVVTGEITPLIDSVFPSSNYARALSLSHDGTRIAYSARTDPEEVSSPVEIYIQNLDGSNPYQLTSTGWEIENPVWSPDDSQIAFLSSGEYSTDQNPNEPIPKAIYMINLDGSNLHEPFITGLNPKSIAWSPDDKLLAVIAGETQSTGDIFYPTMEVITLNTMNIRTGERFILFKTESPNYIYDLTW